MHKLNVELEDRDRTLTRSEARVLSFHISEANRIRIAVLAKANLEPPRPPAITPGPLRSWIRKGQIEIWLWRRWWALIAWPESMERSWQEVFLDDKFRKTTQSRWNKYLNIHGIILCGVLNDRTPFDYYG
jgi:hypothetical protein